LVFVVLGKGYFVGTVYLFFLAIFVPILAVAALNYWPHTSIGRKILNVSPDGEGEPPIEPRYLHLVGKQGVARTKMLPSGAVKIEGKSYDAVAEGAGVEVGDRIEVIRVDGTRIVVRKMRGVPPDQFAGNRSPVSEVIPDPFNDPPV
jgi:membrane-bound serine protease (ClpP class)